MDGKYTVEASTMSRSSTHNKENIMQSTERVLMDKVKETKGAVRYEEANWRDDPNYLIGTLYLRKHALMQQLGFFPDQIAVTVTTDVEE